jgi:AcrR family transcriptional regulator
MTAADSVKTKTETSPETTRPRRTAEDVAKWQRERMLKAMVAAVAEKGYTNVAVADVVQRARVSRATFYEQFVDKADCFVATFHWSVARFVDRLRSKIPSELPPRERLHTLIESYLNQLAGDPDGARVCLVEMYAVGPTAVLHRQQIQLDFVALLEGLHADLAAAGEPVRSLNRFDFEALVGAISSTATNKTALGEVAELPGLLEPMVAFILTHFGLPEG